MTKNNYQVAQVANTKTVDKVDYNVVIRNMSDEERQKSLALTEKITQNDMNSLQTYGAEINQVISQNGDAILRSVRANSGGEIVALTTDLLNQLNLMDADDFKDKGPIKRMLGMIPFIGPKLVLTAENFQTKYNDVSSNIQVISDKMANAKLNALKSNEDLQEIYDNNVEYINQSHKLIVALKVRKMEEETVYKDMQDHPENYEMFEVHKKGEFLQRLDKRIADMETVEFVMQQNLIEIMGTQSNNLAIAEKSDNITNNVIPIWKNQITIALQMNEQAKTIEAQRMLTEKTNQMITQTSKMLHTNSVNVAQQAEQSVISLDTLKTSTQEIIATVQEIQKIHQQGEQERAKIETEITALTKKLEDAIYID